MKIEYLKILEKYNIEYLYHFTSLSNVDSILKNGIMNRKSLDFNKINYNCTDKDRKDKQFDCISLSLSCANRLMLFSKKQTINTEWVIFELNAKKIISDFCHKILYCKYNAASSSTINLLKTNREYFKTIKAFSNMFDINGEPFYQSELLVQGNIKTSYINKIYVENLQIKLVVEQFLINYNLEHIDVVIKKEMF